MRNLFSFIFILLIAISCGTAQKAMVYEEGHTYTLDDYKEIFNYYNVVDSIINNKKFHDDSLKYITEINDIKNKIEDIDIIYYKFECKDNNFGYYYRMNYYEENYYEKLCAEKTESLRQILREKEINFINFLSTKYYIYTFPLEHLCYYDIRPFTESWRYTKSYFHNFFIDFQTYTTNILIQPQEPEKIPSEYYTSYVKGAESFYVKDKWGIKWECLGNSFISEDAMKHYGYIKYMPKFYVVIYYINKSEYKYSMDEIEKSITEFKNCTDKTQQEKLYKEIIWRIHNNNLDNRKRKININDELERLKEYLFDTNIIDQ